MKLIALGAIFTVLPLLSAADIPEIVSVSANESGGTWQFDVTVLHEDSGWDHYADGWGIYTIDGVELGYRILAHPHVNEQPFTRSLSGVVIPVTLTKVILRPHDLVHGDGPDYIQNLHR
jgi:hypothetical protein